MTALLALASAVLVGGADFVGGLGARRAPAALVAATAQLIGIALAVPLALAWRWDEVTSTDVALSLGAGAAVGIGLACFYAAMAIGLISVVAPVAAVTGATLPVVVGFARGEDPGAVAVVGIVLALVAVAAVTVAPGETTIDLAGSGPRVIALSVVAGLLFGVFFVLFSDVDESSGMWPVAVARVASTAALAGVVLALRIPAREVPGVVRYSAVIATLEVAATVPLLLALQRGPLTVASVLASLYPVTTVLLAAGLLRERLTRPQLAGVLLALCAVALVSTA